MEPGQRAFDDGQYLIVSRFEIERVLNGLMRANIPVTVTFGQGEQLVVTRIAEVDLPGDALSFQFGFDKATNQRLLRSDKLTFAANYERRKVQFIGHKAVDAFSEGTPVFRIKFPDAILNLQSRASQRFRIPAINPPRIEINHPEEGNFGATVHDISLGGVGMIDYQPSAYLKPGTLLKQCRIHIPGFGVALADLQVRYTVDIVGENGARIRRSGCQFFGKSADLEKLVDSYIVALQDGRTGHR